jgi:hypothetical protein
MCPPVLTPSNAWTVWLVVHGSPSRQARMDNQPAKSPGTVSLPEAVVPRLQATLFWAYETLYFSDVSRFE